MNKLVYFIRTFFLVTVYKDGNTAWTVFMISVSWRLESKKGMKQEKRNVVL
jgi:hypothetical protein